LAGSGARFASYFKRKKPKVEGKGEEPMGEEEIEGEEHTYVRTPSLSKLQFSHHHLDHFFSKNAKKKWNMRGAFRKAMTDSVDGTINVKTGLITGFT